MTVTNVRQAIRPPLAQLVFSAKIDFIKLGTAGRLELPPLDGQPRWGRQDGARSVTIHDPTPADIRRLRSWMPTLPLREMEVAVDVSCSSSVLASERTAMLERVMLGVFAARLDPQWRGVRPRFRGAAWQRGQSPRPFNKRLPSAYHQLVYGHRVGDPWQTKAYLKRVDMGRSLPEAEWVARVEVALKLEQLAVHRLCTVGDLVGFRYRAELSPYFAHVRGMEPRALGRRPRSALHGVLVRKQSQLLREEFDQVGVGCARHGGRHESVESRTRADSEINNRIGQALQRLQSALSD